MVVLAGDIDEGALEAELVHGVRVEVGEALEAAKPGAAVAIGGAAGVVGGERGLGADALVEVLGGARVEVAMLGGAGVEGGEGGLLLLLAAALAARRSGPRGGEGLDGAAERAALLLLLLVLAVLVFVVLGFVVLGFGGGGRCYRFVGDVGVISKLLIEFQCVSVSIMRTLSIRLGLILSLSIMHIS